MELEATVSPKLSDEDDTEFDWLTSPVLTFPTSDIWPLHLPSDLETLAIGYYAFLFLLDYSFVTLRRANLHFRSFHAR